MTALRLISQRLIQKEPLWLSGSLICVFILLALSWPQAESLHWAKAFAAVLFLLKTALAHRLAWAVRYEWLARPFSQSLKDQVPYLGLAWVLSYGLIAFQAQREGWGWGLLAAQVFFAGGALHCWLLYRGVLDEAAQEPLPEKTEAPSLRVEKNGEEYRLPLAALSAVVVDDHYCTLHYRQGTEPKQLRVYGRLADFEERTSGELFKISRSALVRPEAIKSLGSGRNPEVQISGMGLELQVARSRKKALLERLEKP